MLSIPGCFALKMPFREFTCFSFTHPPPSLRPFLIYLWLFLPPSFLSFFRFFFLCSSFPSPLLAVTLLPPHLSTISRPFLSPALPIHHIFPSPIIAATHVFWINLLLTSTVLQISSICWYWILSWISQLVLESACQFNEQIEVTCVMTLEEPLKNDSTTFTTR